MGRAIRRGLRYLPRYALTCGNAPVRYARYPPGRGRLLSTKHNVARYARHLPERGRTAHDIARLLAGARRNDPEWSAAGSVSALSPITGEPFYMKEKP